MLLFPFDGSPPLWTCATGAGRARAGMRLPTTISGRGGSAEVLYRHARTLWSGRRAGWRAWWPYVHSTMIRTLRQLLREDRRAVPRAVRALKDVERFDLGEAFVIGLIVGVPGLVVGEVGGIGLVEGGTGLGVGGIGLGEGGTGLGVGEVGGIGLVEGGTGLGVGGIGLGEGGTGLGVGVIGLGEGDTGFDEPAGKGALDGLEKAEAGLDFVLGLLCLDVVDPLLDVVGPLEEEASVVDVPEGGVDGHDISFSHSGCKRSAVQSWRPFPQTT